MDAAMGEPAVFVVRVWRRRADFRAAVREVDSERIEVFTRGEDIARYLASGVMPALPVPDSPTSQESP